MKPIHYWVLVSANVVIGLLLNSQLLAMPAAWSEETNREWAPQYLIGLGCFSAMLGWATFALELVLASRGAMAPGRLCVWICFFALSFFFPSVLISMFLVDMRVDISLFYPLLLWGIGLGVFAAALSIFSAHKDLPYARVVPGVFALLHGFAMTSFLAYYIGDLGTWPW
jgi:hypothetical protein